MIIYLDTSALVKVYVKEHNSEKVQSWLQNAILVGSSSISKVEMAAALAKSVRTGSVLKDEAEAAWDKFLTTWRSIYKLTVIDNTIDRASELAWEHGLRGYDAMHLATAVLWQEQTREDIYLATFDRALWQAGRQVGMNVLPEEEWSRAKT